jgi:hypothetical protein
MTVLARFLRSGAAESNRLFGVTIFSFDEYELAASGRYRLQSERIAGVHSADMF